MHIEDGILLVEKPRGWSSYRVVDFLKKRLGAGKLGHAGTLDPLADGLLIVLAGAATRAFSLFQTLPKSYVATVTFGKTTTTDDAEGSVVSASPKPVRLTRIGIARALKRFVGAIEQVPPAFSALKVRGVRAYAIARRGKAPVLAARRVYVYAAKLLSARGASARIEFRVSSGTYIRALARDLGNALGCGAYLAALTRTAIGPYRLRDAKPPERITWGDLRALPRIASTDPAVLSSRQ